MSYDHGMRIVKNLEPQDNARPVPIRLHPDQPSLHRSSIPHRGKHQHPKRSSWGHAPGSRLGRTQPKSWTPSGKSHPSRWDSPSDPVPSVACVLNGEIKKVTGRSTNINQVAMAELARERAGLNAVAARTHLPPGTQSNHFEPVYPDVARRPGTGWRQSSRRSQETTARGPRSNENSGKNFQVDHAGRPVRQKGESQPRG